MHNGAYWGKMQSCRLQKWMENDRPDRSVLHYIIAASMGCSTSSKILIKFCQLGFISKEVFAATLRAHQAAVDATKSPQRDISSIVAF